MKSYKLSGNFVLIKEFEEDYENEYPEVNLTELGGSKADFSLDFVCKDFGDIEGVLSFLNKKFYVQGICVAENSYQFYMMDVRSNTFSLSYDSKLDGDINCGAYMFINENNQVLYYPVCFGNADIVLQDKLDKVVEEEIEHQKDLLLDDEKQHLNKLCENKDNALFEDFQQFSDDVLFGEFSYSLETEGFPLYSVVIDVENMIDNFVEETSNKQQIPVDIPYEKFGEFLREVLEKRNISFLEEDVEDFCKIMFEELEKTQGNENLFSVATAKMLTRSTFLQEKSYDQVPHMIARAMFENLDKQTAYDLFDTFEKYWKDQKTLQEIVFGEFKGNDTALYVISESLECLDYWYKEYKFQSPDEIIDLVKFNYDSLAESISSANEESAQKYDAENNQANPLDKYYLEVLYRTVEIAVERDTRDLFEKENLDSNDPKIVDAAKSKISEVVEKELSGEDNALKEKVKEFFYIVVNNRMNFKVDIDTELSKVLVHYKDLESKLFYEDSNMLFAYGVLNQFEDKNKAQILLQAYEYTSQQVIAENPSEYIKYIKDLHEITFEKTNSQYSDELLKFVKLEGLPIVADNEEDYSYFDYYYDSFEAYTKLFYEYLKKNNFDFNSKEINVKNLMDQENEYYKGLKEDLNDIMELDAETRSGLKYQSAYEAFDDACELVDIVVAVADYNKDIIQKILKTFKDTIDEFANKQDDYENVELFDKLTGILGIQKCENLQEELQEGYQTYKDIAKIALNNEILYQTLLDRANEVVRYGDDRQNIKNNGGENGYGIC